MRDNGNFEKGGAVSFKEEIKIIKTRCVNTKEICLTTQTAGINFCEMSNSSA